MKKYGETLEKQIKIIKEYCLSYGFEELPDMFNTHIYCGDVVFIKNGLFVNFVILKSNSEKRVTKRISLASDMADKTYIVVDSVDEIKIARKYQLNNCEIALINGNNIIFFT